MLYKKNHKEVITRLSELYSNANCGKIYAAMKINNPVIEEFSRSSASGETAYPDPRLRIAFWDSVCAQFADLEDDSIPCAYLTEFDEGLYGGMVGGEVRFVCFPQTGWISSMTVPFLKDLNDAKDLAVDRHNDWYRLYLEQLKIFKHNSAGKFAISHMILIDGMNFLYELRGATNSYYDLLDEPLLTKSVFEFSIELNCFVQDAFFNIIGLYDGGTCSTLGQWLPGRIVSESVDPFGVTSKEMFEDHGIWVMEKVFAHYDGGLVHVHSNAMHLLESLASVEKIKCLYLTDDDTSNYTLYKSLYELDLKRKNVPIVITVPYEAFADMLRKRELPAKVLYNIVGVPNVSEANKMMKAVKSYSV